jgi:hypothetical protein
MVDHQKAIIWGPTLTATKTWTNSWHTFSKPAWPISGRARMPTAILNMILSQPRRGMKGFVTNISSHCHLLLPCNPTRIGLRVFNANESRAILHISISESLYYKFRPALLQRPSQTHCLPKYEQYCYYLSKKPSRLPHYVFLSTILPCNTFLKVYPYSCLNDEYAVVDYALTTLHSNTFTLGHF